MFVELLDQSIFVLSQITFLIMLVTNESFQDNTIRNRLKFKQILQRFVNMKNRKNTINTFFGRNKMLMKK